MSLDTCGGKEFLPLWQAKKHNSGDRHTGGPSTGGPGSILHLVTPALSAGRQLVMSDPLALCYTSGVQSYGEHRPSAAVMGMAACGMRTEVNACRAMRQRKLGSHTPPCHRRMVITTLFSVLLAALQRRPHIHAYLLSSSSHGPHSRRPSLALALQHVTPCCACGSGALRRPAFSFLDCSVSPWRPFHLALLKPTLLSSNPGQLEPTTSLCAG